MYRSTNIRNVHNYSFITHLLQTSTLLSSLLLLRFFLVRQKKKKRTFIVIRFTSTFIDIFYFRAPNIMITDVIGSFSFSSHPRQYGPPVPIVFGFLFPACRPVIPVVRIMIIAPFPVSLLFVLPDPPSTLLKNAPLKSI